MHFEDLYRKDLSIHPFSRGIYRRFAGYQPPKQTHSIKLQSINEIQLILPPTWDPSNWWRHRFAQTNVCDTKNLKKKKETC